MFFLCVGVLFLWNSFRPTVCTSVAPQGRNEGVRQHACECMGQLGAEARPRTRLIAVRSQAQDPNWKRKGKRSVTEKGYDKKER